MKKYVDYFFKKNIDKLYIFNGNINGWLLGNYCNYQLMCIYLCRQRLHVDLH